MNKSAERCSQKVFFQKVELKRENCLENLRKEWNDFLHQHLVMSLDIFCFSSQSAGFIYSISAHRSRQH